MNIENIKALADIMVQKGLSSLEISEGETKIRLTITKGEGAKEMPSEKEKESCINISAGPQKEEETLDFNNIEEIKSPIVGVFYSAASPDSEPYVTIGSKVKKGDVLCIIEAMKLMNEICAERDGEIVDICIKNGELAEFGQVLFKLY